jgi:uncharacterized protein YbaA (DUF1428 family)
MPRYVDGFVMPIPQKSLVAYKKIAKVASKIWMDHGALSYRECVGEDLTPPMGIPFPKLTGAKKSETIVFAWIEFRSRAHRDRVNKLVMKDPRMLAFCNQKMPFDCTRMTYGGFEVIVQG